MGFRTEFDKKQKEVHELACEKGWWDGDRSTMECLMLAVTELAEAAEELRKDNFNMWSTDPHTGKPLGFASELADVVIRIMDLAENMNIDLAATIEDKHNFNKTRPYKHGKKC